jgi:hypothetical protein
LKKTGIQQQAFPSMTVPIVPWSPLVVRRGVIRQDGDGDVGAVLLLGVF